MRIKQLLACVATIAVIGCHSSNQRCDQCQTASCEVAEPPATVRISRAAPPGVPPAPCIQPAPCVQKKAPCVQKAPCVEAPGNRKVTVDWKPSGNFGHAKDFSWLMGNLRRVHVNGGSWKIRYAPLDQQDYWGGSVVLSDDARIEKFKDGDAVYVEGEIIVARPTVYLSGPLYRISRIRRATDAERRKAWATRLKGTSIRK